MTTHDDRAGQPVCRVDGLVYRLYRHIIARSRLTVQTLGQRDDTALGVNSKLSFCCVARINDLVSQLAVLACNSNTGVEWRSAGTGLCSYRVRGVDGSCAKRLTVESYTIGRYAANIYNSLLLVLHHPLALSFHA